MEEVPDGVVDQVLHEELKVFDTVTEVVDSVAFAEGINRDKTEILYREALPEIEDMQTIQNGRPGYNIVIISPLISTLINMAWYFSIPSLPAILEYNETNVAEYSVYILVPRINMWYRYALAMYFGFIGDDFQHSVMPGYAIRIEADIRICAPTIKKFAAGPESNKCYIYSVLDAAVAIINQILELSKKCDETNFESEHTMYTGENHYRNIEKHYEENYNEFRNIEDYYDELTHANILHWTGGTKAFKLALTHRKKMLYDFINRVRSENQQEPLIFEWPQDKIKVSDIIQL